MGITHVLTTAANERRVPLSSNPVINDLITLRLSHPDYTGEPQQVRKLPICVMESVLSDEALGQIPYDHILSFREKARDYYNAWAIETDKVEAKLTSNGFTYKPSEIDNYIRQEVNPGIFRLKREIEKIRDDMFKDILLSTGNFVFAAVSSCTVSQFNIPAAIGTFLLTNLKTGILLGNVAKNLLRLRDAEKDNGLTYLLKATKLTSSDH